MMGTPNTMTHEERAFIDGLEGEALEYAPTTWEKDRWDLRGFMPLSPAARSYAEQRVLAIRAGHVGLLPLAVPLRRGASLYEELQARGD